MSSIFRLAVEPSRASNGASGRVVSLDKLVGRQIANGRLRKGFSQSDLAQALCISSVALTAIEEGRLRCSAELILSLADVLQERPGSFFADLVAVGSEAGSCHSRGRAQDVA